MRPSAVVGRHDPFALLAETETLGDAVDER